MTEKDIQVIESIILLTSLEHNEYVNKRLGDLILYVVDHLPECLAKTLLEGMVKFCKQGEAVPTDMLVLLHDEMVEVYGMKSLE